ncbi:MAG TPA: hypothetical protein VK934_10550 [Fimbriimonas sp.]|nr:hypothetical protein [Fimbriimonas sp.]
MTVRLRFDGKVFVPETPVRLRVDEVVLLEIDASRPDAQPELFDRVMDLFRKHGVRNVDLTDESLSRDSFYENRGL